jgi:hypothetical protein
MHGLGPLCGLLPADTGVLHMQTTMPTRARECAHESSDFICCCFFYCTVNSTRFASSSMEWRPRRIPTLRPSPRTCRQLYILPQHFGFWQIGLGFIRRPFFKGNRQAPCAFRLEMCVGVAVGAVPPPPIPMRTTSRRPDGRSGIVRVPNSIGQTIIIYLAHRSTGDAVSAASRLTRASSKCCL